MHLQEIFDLTLTIKVTWSIALYIMWPMYLQSLKLLQRIVKEMHFQEKNIIWSWPLGQGGQGHMKCCPVPSTSCDLCTSKVWCCYIQWLRRKCIYKKIHYLTLGSRSHKMLPSTLDIMWLMYQQSLILLHPTVKEKMHLQENTLFDLDEMLPSALYIMWPMHLQSLVNLSPWCPVMVEWLFLAVPWGCLRFVIVVFPDHTHYFWSYYIKRFRRRCIYKKIQYLTLTLGSMSQEMLRSALYIMWPIQLQSLKLLCLTD